VKAKEKPYHSLNSLKGDCGEMGVSLFSQVTAIGPAVAPREVQVGYEEKVLQKSGAAVAGAALEAFKNRVDVALRDVVGGDGLMVGHGDLRGLFQP